MARGGWFKIQSIDLAHRTADLTDAEFRAWILIQARANDVRANEHGGEVHIARSTLPSVAPNRRGSVSTSARVVRELCSKVTWGVREGDAKWTIYMQKHEQKQGSEVPTKTKTKTKTKKTKQKERRPPSEVGLDLSQDLEHRVRTLRPNCKTPRDLSKWGYAYDLAISADGRSWTEISAQLAWLFSDANQSAECRFEIFSAKKHRDRFDAIARMMSRANRPTEASETKMQKIERIIREDGNEYRERLSGVGARSRSEDPGTGEPDGNLF